MKTSIISTKTWTKLNILLALAVLAWLLGSCVPAPENMEPAQSPQNANQGSPAKTSGGVAQPDNPNPDPVPGDQTQNPPPGRLNPYPAQAGHTQNLAQDNSIPGLLPGYQAQSSPQDNQNQDLYQENPGQNHPQDNPEQGSSDNAANPQAPDTSGVPSAPSFGLQVSFKLDERITKSLYMGERWVSPPTYDTMQAGDTFSVEARVEGTDANGMPIEILPEWIAAEPDIVVVSPSQGHAVTITVQRPGETSIMVTSQGVSKTLFIKAELLNGLIRVAISQ